MPLALLLWAARPEWWPISVFAIALRAVSVWVTGVRVLGDRTLFARLGLVAVEELLSFGFWIAGFFGNTVKWRGHSYVLNRDGTFDPRPGG